MEALRENNVVRLKDKKDAGELIAEVAEKIGTLSVGIADVVGHTLEVQSAIDAQNKRLKVIAEATREITDANRNIADISKLTNEIAGQAREDINSSTESIRSAVTEMGGLISAVEESGSELSGLEVAMEGVTRVTNDIRTVARQTNMLAINASVEAARAGQAGVGFAVVANEVKALARKTAEATVSIDRTLATLTNRIRSLTERMAVSAERAVKVGNTASTIGGAVEKVGLAVTRVCDQAEGIAVATGNISERCDQFRESVDALNIEATRSTVALNSTAENVSRVLTGAEVILMLTATSGYHTQDTPFIEKAMETAAAVQACFMRSIESGDITVEDLFDKQLKPIPNTNPQQYMTRYIEFLDWAVNPLCDAVLNFDKRVVWCAPTDHNKMIPSHNPNFSRQPSSDPVWNAAHCRNRRIYNDKTAAAVSTSTAPFLLQTYRRDMGGGVFVLMKDASAPVFVGGRLWGGIRVCYSAT